MSDSVRHVYCSLSRMHKPLDSKLLLNFHQIAAKQSLRQAAKTLNLTTSAVSHSLKRLEEDLGCKLFERDTRKITLTYAGQRLQKMTSHVLGELTQMRNLVSEWGDARQKSIRIGVSPIACQHILPIALRELKESFPAMNVQIRTGTSYQLHNDLIEEQVDLVICPSNKDNDKLKYVPLGKDYLEFVVNPLHPWALKGSVDIELIHLERIIVTDSDSYTFDLINNYLRTYQQTLNPFIEISNEDVIKRLVELNIGIGILPNWAIENELSVGRLKSFSLKRKKLTRFWALAHRKSHGLTFPECMLAGLVGSISKSILC